MLSKLHKEMEHKSRYIYFTDFIDLTVGKQTMTQTEEHTIRTKADDVAATV